MVITGASGTGRQELARALEMELFELGRYVFFLGIGSVVHGLDADLESTATHRREHIRRFGQYVLDMDDCVTVFLPFQCDAAA